MEACEFGEEAKVPEKLCIRQEQRIRHAIDSEYARVCRNPIDGMYTIPSANNVYVWFGVLFIRRGLYGGGVFRFTLRFPDEFPNTRTIPTVVFDSDIFHPSICPKTRVLNLKKTFPDGFKKEKHNALNVLVAIQRIFFSYEAECDGCSNKDAAVMWKENKDRFKDLCKDCVNKSRAQAYDEPPQSNDKNAIRLTPWDPSIHEGVREKIMSNNRGRENYWNERIAGKQNGFSWIDIDRMTYMTEPTNSKLLWEDNNESEKERLAFGIERLDLSGVSPDEDLEIVSGESIVADDNLMSEDSWDDSKDDKPEVLI